MRRRVMQVATFDIVSVPDTATIEEAAALSALAVRDAAREYVGIVTTRDLMRGLLACVLPVAA